jgi:TRAP-type C4-dicarboxylate transport system permease small subunit
VNILEFKLGFNTTEDFFVMIFKFIRENILTAIVLIPILYVVFFGVIVDFVSASFSITVFEDLTTIIFLWAIVFGIAWLALEEIQEGKSRKQVNLSQ